VGSLGILAAGPRLRMPFIAERGGVLHMAVYLGIQSLRILMADLRGILRG
jgi:hypothetical protein